MFVKKNNQWGRLQNQLGEDVRIDIDGVLLMSRNKTKILCF